MALFTEADRDAIRDAMVTLAVDGIASVSVGGQTVTAHRLEDLRKLLDMVLADLVPDEDGGSFGLRMLQLRGGPTG